MPTSPTTRSTTTATTVDAAGAAPSRPSAVAAFAAARRRCARAAIVALVACMAHAADLSAPATNSAVAAANTAPTISAIAAQSVPGGVVLTVPFTVGDAETAAASLTVSASSSVTAVLPASAIALNGSDAARRATLTPAMGATGTTTVTLTVSDGSLSTSTSFTVTVTGTLAMGVHAPAGRIAISHDGNSYDIDDIGATAMDTALIGTAGLGARLVHFDYDDNLALNDPARQPQMQESALGGASRFGLDAARFFDDQAQLAAAIANFKAEAEKSTAADPLWFICAGPMEVPWRCVNAVDPAKRGFIRCISHSGWNDSFTGPQSTHGWSALTALGVVAYHIIDQNGSNGDYDWQTPESYWYWLRDATDPKLRWLYSRDSAHFDVSDSGMTYWLISGGPAGGNQRAGWPEAKSLLLGTTRTNQPPVANAGPDLTATLAGGAATAALHGTVADDGLPSGTLTARWSVVSGPAAVAFAAAGSADTTATFTVAGAYVLRLTASDGASTTTDDVAVTVGAGGARGPFGGAARSIASVIQAEDYDTGGEAIAYHDATTANEGGSYRSDGVDLEACADAGGGFDVGWVSDGEWLEYTVTVPTAAAYTAAIRTASATAGGTIALSLDGRALTTVAVAGTGGWQAWQTSTSAAIDLPSGTHVLRLAFSGGSGYLFNVNSIAFAPITIATPTVTGFTLIDAATDRPIVGYDPIAPGAVIPVDALGATGGFNLRANVAGSVAAVRFDLDGVVGYRTETAAPYALAGDVAGDYQPWTLANGQHTVVATPSAGGAVGAAASLTFTLASGARVTGFTLIDARTEQPVPGFDPLPANATIDTAALGTTQLNLRANTVGAVGSVRFALDGAASYRVESAAPWALAGDNAGDYQPWALGLGAHQVTATPFAGTGATGTAGIAATARFTIVGSAGAATGGSTPTATGTTTTTAAVSSGASSGHGCGRGSGTAAIGIAIALLGQLVSRRAPRSARPVPR